MMTTTVAANLTTPQKHAYDRDGFTLVPGVFAARECDEFVQHMMDLHSGRKSIEGFAPRKPDEFGRAFQPHFYDPRALELLIHPRLRGYLEDATGGEVEAVQTMYFWVGSEQHRHQDQYYLPGCFSAWIALADVGPQNGTIWVQPGSHKGRLITMADFRQPNGELMPMFGPHYDNAVDALYETNGTPEVPVVARKGDFVIFDGRLIHRGGKIEQPGSFRHVMANHYIPAAFKGWTHDSTPRIKFDGTRRLGN